LSAHAGTVTGPALVSNLYATEPSAAALAAVVALSALVACDALVAVAALVALSALDAWPALVADGTVESVPRLMLAPVSEFGATFDPVTAPFLIFAVDTAPFANCLAPTLAAGNLNAA
jgi:hypothetical protein